MIKLVASRQIFIMSSMLLILFLCCNEKAENYFKVKKEIINGIEIINNPGRPKKLDLQIRFEEDLTIWEPGDGDEKYIFYAPVEIKADNNKNIYVLDRMLSNIRIYDKFGNFKQQIGRKGQGPGEFMFPSGFDLDKSNNILVCDEGNRRISILSADGSLKSELHLAYFRFSDIFATDTSFILKIESIDDKTGFDKIEYIRFSYQGQKLAEYKNYLGHFSVHGNQTITLYSPLPVFAVDDNLKHIYTSNSEFLEIEQYNFSGDLIKKFKREFLLIPVTKQDKDEWFKRFSDIITKRPDLIFKFCEYKPSISSMLIDDEHNLWIKTNEKDKNDNYRWDIFDSKGIYIANTFTSINILYIRDNIAYSILFSEDKNPIIKRYKLIKS